MQLVYSAIKAGLLTKANGIIVLVSGDLTESMFVPFESEFCVSQKVTSV